MRVNPQAQRKKRKEKLVSRAVTLTGGTQQAEVFDIKEERRVESAGEKKMARGKKGGSLLSLLLHREREKVVFLCIWYEEKAWNPSVKGGKKRGSSSVRAGGTHEGREGGGKRKVSPVVHPAVKKEDRSWVEKKRKKKKGSSGSRGHRGKKFAAILMVSGKRRIRRGLRRKGSGGGEHACRRKTAKVKGRGEKSARSVVI